MTVTILLDIEFYLEIDRQFLSLSADPNLIVLVRAGPTTKYPVVHLLTGVGAISALSPRTSGPSSKLLLPKASLIVPTS